MATLVQLRPSPEMWALPPSNSLHQAFWNAWVSTGRDIPGKRASWNAVTWISAATMFAAAAQWSHLEPYGVVVGLILLWGAVAVAFRCFRVKQYAFAAMIRPPMIVRRSSLASLVIFGAVSTVTWAGDLSKYRKFQLGTNISTVAKQTGTPVSDARTIHGRPAVIQEIQWRPSGLGMSPPESAKDVLLTFFDGRLFKITVNYDRYDTEGMTSEDMVEAISATYGIATKPSARMSARQKPYDDEEVVLAQWQDSQHRFDLIGSSYGPSFRLVGVLKPLEVEAEAAILKAISLEEQEAPAREAARVASEDNAARVKLDKARSRNKLKFRP